MPHDFPTLDELEEAEDEEEYRPEPVDERRTPGGLEVTVYEDDSVLIRQNPSTQTRTVSVGPHDREALAEVLTDG